MSLEVAYDNLLAQLKATQAERDELQAVFSLVIDELNARRRSGDRNSPGHGHKVPGVWDSDNGVLAGKPCAWCAVWTKATEMRAAMAKEQPLPGTHRDTGESFYKGRIFQDAEGTIPVTETGQPVGLIRDDNGEIAMLCANEYNRPVVQIGEKP